MTTHPDDTRDYAFATLADRTTIYGPAETVARIIADHIDARCTAGDGVALADASIEVLQAVRPLKFKYPAKIRIKLDLPK